MLIIIIKVFQVILAIFLCIAFVGPISYVLRAIINSFMNRFANKTQMIERKTLIGPKGVGWAVICLSIYVYFVMVLSYVRFLLKIKGTNINDFYVLFKESFKNYPSSFLHPFGVLYLTSGIICGICLLFRKWKRAFNLSRIVFIFGSSLLLIFNPLGNFWKILYLISIVIVFYYISNPSIRDQLR